jgi:hypothetical protein
MIYRSNNA